NLLIERFRPDFPVLLRNCRLSVSQAGYNTVMDVLAASARAVVIPFAEGGETEQPTRARLLADRGLLTVLDPERLTPDKLAAAIDAAVDNERPTVSFDMFGSDNTARLVVEAIDRQQRSRLASLPPGGAGRP